MVGHPADARDGIDGSPRPSRAPAGTHLIRRFLSSLVPGPPDPDDEAWLLGLLTPAEAALYRAQPVLDRRHSVQCAAAVRESMGDRATTPVVVASALHDVGKAEVGLGTFGRVGATVIGAIVADDRLARWERGAGWRHRVAAYRHHDVRGAELLTLAGSDPLVVSWAAEHHRDPLDRTIPDDVARVLWAADH